jgi:hypothetical protein
MTGIHALRAALCEISGWDSPPFIRPWHRFVPESAGGETRKASPDKGRCIISAAADGLARFLAQLASARDTAAFPYEPVKKVRRHTGRDG